MTDDPEAALLAAVQADPGDLQARTVYADWLEERGDPRGEYLRLDMQLVTLPARLADLVERIDPAWIRSVNGRFRISITAVGRDKIAAIKLVRELTGMGLKDAKDLVESVTASSPAVLVNDVELDAATEIVRKCEASMTLDIAPRLPPSMPIAPFGPRGYRRPYRVLLVGVSDRLAMIRELHTRYMRPLDEARTIVDRIAAGEPFVLAVHLDSTAAAELGVTFGAIGTVRIEHP